MASALRDWGNEPSLLMICFFVVTISLSNAQDQPGFISIDCGLPPKTSVNYRDLDTHIFYKNDEDYIDTGINNDIDEYHLQDSVYRPLWTVRSFPNGTRNCYNLTEVQGKGEKYLIRATFFYGNYDHQNQPPTFDLHLGVERWDTVGTKNDTTPIVKELIHVPSSNYLYVCLINTGNGIPFISALELRRLDKNIYPTDNPGDSLAFFWRFNLAPVDPYKVISIRYPDDIYDRIWSPYRTPDFWVEIKSNTTLNVTENSYSPPQKVMKTAVMPRDDDQPLNLEWKPPNPNIEFYVFMHFAEVAELQSNEYRGFYVDLTKERSPDQPIVPEYLSVFTRGTSRGENKVRFKYSLRKTENSTLPPIINALEVYSEMRFVQSQTDENDVRGILNIKSRYKVNGNWQGDPCLPKKFKWDGIDCSVSRNASIPPRITSLNLSSSGLTGDVPSDLSLLTSLENLDLSYNSLNGPIPGFLAELLHLKFLNLSGNQLKGKIPKKLLDKAKSGLQLRVDGYDSYGRCEADLCRSKKSKKFVVPVVITLTSSLVILAALIVILKLRRARNSSAMLRVKQNKKDTFLEPKNMQFTYTDILKMTNNFQRVIGNGSFGTVYHGLTADGKQVAVKVLSPSSSQGYNEFQREADLLTKVYHRNLTHLVGYCYEDTHMALVYEYMDKGNLRENLSETDGHILSWSERLQILLDAAQGLDYLHNGCKPPIVHRDVKSTNILLTKNFEAKLADFGLSRAFAVDDGAYVSTRVVGTLGYLDPEYYETHRLHEKSDIYSLGIVMLELITGRLAIMWTEEKRHVAPWASEMAATGDIASIVDPKLEGKYDINSAWKTLKVAMACTSSSSAKRPNMAHVISELKECLAAQKVREESQSTGASIMLEVNPEILKSQVWAR